MVVVALALMVALAALDAALGSDTLPTGLFIVGPLLVAARGTPRATGAVAAVAVALAVATGLITGTLHSGADWLRVVVVGVGGAVAIWIATLRSGSEEAERRQHTARDELEVILEAVADGITAQERTG